MRTIKFRGKVEDNWWHATVGDGGWEQFWALVDKKTIGQYTGINDCNGVEIYEGDIVRTANDPHPEYGSNDFEASYEGVVTYCEAAYEIVQDGQDYTPFLCNIYIDKMEVIGNSHDDSGPGQKEQA